MNKMKKIVLLFTLAFIILSMASCDLLRDYYDEYGHVHTYSDWVITKEASCFEEGIQTRICNNCDKTQTLPISAGHRWQSDWTVIKDATCTEDGLRERICDFCQAKESEAIAAPTFHPWGNWTITKEATCTEDGLREKICDSCQAKESEAIAALTLHPWGAWEIIEEATCDEVGERKRTCTSCGEVKSENVAATSHAWGDWTITKEATCTEDGSKERTCSSCNEKQIETVVASAHTFIDGVCSKCNALRMSNIILPEPPITLNYRSWASITITSLRIEIDKSGSTEYVKIYYTAEKTYDDSGAGSTLFFSIYKLYDSQGYVVRQGTVSHYDLVVGDKVAGSISLGKLLEFDPNETYTLVLTDYK